MFFPFSLMPWLIIQDIPFYTNDTIWNMGFFINMLSSTFIINADFNIYSREPFTFAEFHSKFIPSSKDSCVLITLVYYAAP